MKNLKIAITGGIGSGKSLAMQILKEAGYKTVSFDEVYAELLKQEEFVLLVSNAFGIKPIKTDCGLQLDKKTLSAIVFNNEQLLKKLNAITHGEIFKRAFSIYQSETVIYEVPLLFEGDYAYLFNEVIVILRDEEMRIQSACKRDDVSAEQVKQKIKNQVDYEKIDLSLHTIIKNDGDIQSFKVKVLKAIDDIKKKQI